MHACSKQWDGDDATAEALAAAMLDLWRQILTGSTRDLVPPAGRRRSLDEPSPEDAPHPHGVREEGSPSVKELAGRAQHVPPQRVSHDRRSARSAGWSSRREDEHDRRIKRVGPTPAARELIDRVDTARLHGLAAWAAGALPVQRSTLLDALSLLPKERPDDTPRCAPALSTRRTAAGGPSRRCASPCSWSCSTTRS